MSEPAIKRAIAFIDGQNLFHAVQRCFGFKHPNYDPALLARAMAQRAGWNLSAVYFYTGVPTAQRNPVWHEFWIAKLAAMGRDGVNIFSKPLVYQSGVPIEKGIDVRLALDVVRLAGDGALDVAVLFSRDQDLAEVAREIRLISQRSDRWIKIASSLPAALGHRTRGINFTDWLPFDKALYDTCIDPRNYRTKPPES